MMTIIKGAEVYSPAYLGTKDVLLGGTKILSIEDSIDITSQIPHIRHISGKGKLLVPGFVDTHVHICGGGGEGGFTTRTPEINLSSILAGGISSMVGVLGTDGTSRTMANLLAKAYSLGEEGIDTWILSGSYQLPLRTLTGSITDDIMFVEKIIGCGEICLADHRSSHPSPDELIRVVSDSRLGGLLSGKAGIVNVHMGDSQKGLSLLKQITEHSDIPLSQLQPTHMNRNARLFKESITYAQKGGYIDLTTSTTPQFLEGGEVAAAEALKILLDNSVDPGHITFSSDAQGSLPVFNEQGELTGLTIGQSVSLLQSFRDAVLEYNVPLEFALRAVSTTPAKRYKLPGKGIVKTGADADVLLLDKKDLSLETMLAGNILMVDEGVPLKKGVFE